MMLAICDELGSRGGQGNGIIAGYGDGERVLRLEVFRTDGHCWLLIRHPIVNDGDDEKIRRAFARMDERLKRVLFEQEARRRRAAARKRLGAADVTTSTRRR
jgi:hypothetical protein